MVHDARVWRLDGLVYFGLDDDLQRSNMLAKDQIDGMTMPAIV
jgi:hypothetical protein